MNISDYKDRHEAGNILAKALSDYTTDDTVILALPRGGVPIAAPIVKKLQSEFDIIIPRKIGAPSQKEVAIGAVTEEGNIILNELLIERLQVSSSYIDTSKEYEIGKIKRRLNAYRKGRPPVNLKDKIVIIVDDGIATGFTMHAAILSVQLRKPKIIILAVPVAPPETIDELSELVDNVVCPLQVTHFQAVGQFYQEFNQVSDKEVNTLLDSIWNR